MSHIGYMTGLTKYRKAIFTPIIAELTNKSGLEIGGPSKVFHEYGILPIYPIIRSLDGCNFSEKTLWEGRVKKGKTYNYYKQKKGRQFVCEATDLIDIPSSSYDFLVSSHCLEHIANPLKALKEWLRVLVKGGTLILSVPDRRRCYVTKDHMRVRTSIEHLIDDMKNDVGENDLTHLPETEKIHNFRLKHVSYEQKLFIARYLQNDKYRCIHHHVFDKKLVKEIFRYLRVKVIYIGSDILSNLVAMGKK
jgi:SAM-dependent methyltransferase